MKRFNGLSTKMVIVTLSIFLLCSSYCMAEQAWQEEGADLVARITVIGGRLERYDPETKAWMITVPDAPVGIDDQLFAGADTRVEILIPNNTLLRIGEETEVRLVSLTEKLTEIDLFSGTARLYNNSSWTDIVAATPFGRIAVPPGASVDLYVDDKVVEILSLEDSVFFTDGASAVRHEVIAGSAAILVYSDRIMPSNGSADRSWNKWNQDRNIFWAERRRFSGESQDYLPKPLHDETYVLDTSGSWQRVYYQGAYYRFWRPRNVGFGWAPFTMGRWMNWRGDRVWIPREPFGYVTHHYGNWIYTLNAWYWAPPVSLTMMARPGLPLLKIGFGWYPGRVAWIDAGVQMNWIPLAPFEPYYCRYPWGFRTIVIAHGSYPRYVASHKFKYHRHTVRGRRDHFYRNNRGSHVSRWRTARRSGVYSSLASRNKGQLETRSFRNTREKKTDNRIREDGKWKRNPTRDRRKHSEARIKKDHEGKVAGQGRNSFGSSLRTGKRKSSVGANNSVVSTRPGKSRQPNHQTTERRSNQLKTQHRPPRSTGNIQQSGSQNRSSLTRANKNALRKNPSDRVKGQIKNRYGSEIKKGNRKITVEANNSAVSALPEKSRQFNQQTAERRINQLKTQNRLPQSTGNIRQSGSQNRPGVTRTDKNAARMGNRTRRNR